MQSSLSVNNTPVFQAKVSSNFKNAAFGYFEKMSNKVEQKKKHFEKCSNRYYKYGFDKAVVDYRQQIVDGKEQFVLFAQDGDKKIILSTKDQFRKIVEKFMHMSGFEFGVKMTQKKNVF